MVATHPAVYPAGPPPRSRAAAPDVTAAAAQVLRAALADRMVEDLHTLVTVNTLVAGRRRGRHRDVPFVFAGPAPSQDGRIGELAERRFAAEFGGPAGLRRPDLWLLSRLIGGSDPGHGELLSYLFFDPAFMEPLIALGARDARRAVGATAVWRSRLPDTLHPLAQLAHAGA